MSLYQYVSDKNNKKKSFDNVHKKRSLLLLKLQIGILFLIFGVNFIFLPVANKFSKKEATPITAVRETAPEVAGVSDQTIVVSPTPTVVPPSPTSSPPPLPPPPPSTPTPSPVVLPKNSYRIAVIGDSMVDTMGELMEYLDHSLKRKYPNTTFALYNYGIGAENVEMGLDRFNNDFHYQTRNYMSIAEVKPDIIVVASFAYNPFSPFDRDRHWLGLTHLVQKAQSVTPNVYMLAEIAPLRASFGRGPNGVNWDTQTNIEHSGKIIKQLENAVGLSQTLHVPLIDVYHRSLVPFKAEGEKKYVNPSDGIHPSIEGHAFTADTIADELVFE